MQCELVFFFIYYSTPLFLLVYHTTRTSVFRFISHTDSSRGVFIPRATVTPAVAAVCITMWRREGLCTTIIYTWPVAGLLKTSVDVCEHNPFILVLLHFKNLQFIRFFSSKGQVLLKKKIVRITYLSICFRFCLQNDVLLVNHDKCLWTWDPLSPARTLR